VPGQEGVALMMTLWVMTLLAALAMSFSFFSRAESLATRNFKDETKAYYAALAAYEEVLHYLYTDKDAFVDYADEDGSLLTDRERTGVSGSRVVDGIEVTVRLTDEESRLNLNVISPEAFKRALSYVGIPDEELNEISDSLLDWKDFEDRDATHLNGAESDYYETLDPPYKAKNAPLDSVEELLLVKGFRGEYLLGGEGLKPLASIATVHGEGINVNMVSREVMEMLGVNASDIDRVIEERKLIGGLRAVPPALAVMGVNLTRSTHFRVEVAARPVDARQALKITSIVRRADEGEGFGLKSVYWREGFELSGA
jgi:general secretion pathway protein K